MSVYLDEFLYRGRPEGSDQPPAYHVILGSVTRDGFGKTVVTTSDALTPEQAEAAGFPLPAALAAINAGAMAENALLRAECDRMIAAAQAAAEDARAEARAAILRAETADERGDFLARQLSEAIQQARALEAKAADIAPTEATDASTATA